jgi:PKD repeat protein
MRPYVLSLFAFLMGQQAFAQQPVIVHWDADQNLTTNQGGKVTQWVSADASARSAAPLSPQIAPDHVASVGQLNGHAAVAFGITNAAVQPLYFPAITIDTASVFAVVNLPAVANTMHFYVAGDVNGVYSGGFWVGGTQPGTDGFGWGSQPPYANWQSTSEVTGWAVLAMRNNGFWLNGAPVSIHPSPSWSGFPHSTVINHLGGIDLPWATNQYIFKGYLAEMMIFDGYLSDSAMSAKSDSLVAAHLPILDIGPDTIDTCLTSLVLEPAGGHSFGRHLWSTGDTSRSITITQNGTYWIETETFGRVQYDTITVNGIIPPPLMEPSNDTLLCKESPFWVRVVNPQPGITYTWSNGVVGDSAFVNQSGTYFYQLSSSNCTVNSTPIQVSSHVLPDFASQEICLGDTTSFTNTSVPLAGFISEWHYDFGDGNSDTLQNPKHAYQQAGTYLVQLAARNSLGCSDTIVKPVVVKEPPVANFTNQGLCKGQPVQFGNTSSIPGGFFATSYQWRFDGLDSSQNVSPSFTFPQQTDTFWVSLEVGINNGCKDDSVRQIVINKSVDAQVFSEADSICAGGSVGFLDASQYQNTQAANFSWFRNNLAVGSSDSLQLVFSNAGTQSISLIVNSSDNCIDTAAFELEVIPNPEAAVELNSDLGIPPFALQAVNQSSGASSVEWYGPAGFTVTNDSLFVLLSDTGLYELGLRTENFFGCSDSLSKTIRVIPANLEVLVEGLECSDSAGYYTGSFVLRNVSEFLDVNGLDISFSLQGASLLREVWEDNLAPGALLPFEFTAQVFSTASPNYCCVQLNELWSNLPSGIYSEEGGRICSPIQSGLSLSPPVPNPSSGITELFIILPETETVEWNLSSASGAVVQEDVLEGAKGLNVLRLDLSAVEAGVYTFELRYRDRALIERIVRTTAP